jgi:hypothetical protein
VIRRVHWRSKIVNEMQQPNSIPMLVRCTHNPLLSLVNLRRKNWPFLRKSIEIRQYLHLPSARKAVESADVRKNWVYKLFDRRMVLLSLEWFLTQHPTLCDRHTQHPTFCDRHSAENMRILSRQVNARERSLIVCFIVNALVKPSRLPLTGLQALTRGNLIDRHFFHKIHVFSIELADDEIHVFSIELAFRSAIFRPASLQNILTLTILFG